MSEIYEEDKFTDEQILEWKEGVLKRREELFRHEDDSIPGYKVDWEQIEREQNEQSEKFKEEKRIRDIESLKRLQSRKKGNKKKEYEKKRRIKHLMASLGMEAVA